MSPKHTPGPWSVVKIDASNSDPSLPVENYGLFIRSASRGLIFEVFAVGDTRDEKTPASNASLAAAAPELLAELKEWASDHVERYLDLIKRETVDDEDARWLQKYERTRAAIAKAEASK